MAAWLDAFGPAFGLIALGILLRRRLLRDGAVWAGMESLVFWVLLPALLAAAISTVNLRTLPLGGVALAIWAGLGVGTVAGLALARLMRDGHATATSILQGSIRFNNFTAFAVVGGLYGAPGVALGGVAAGCMTPMVQLIVTVAFAAGGGRRFSPLAFLRTLALNPLLIGCALGFVFAAFGGLPPGLAPLARQLGQAGVAVGLLCVGAALAPASLGERPGTQAAAAALKLVVLPAVVLAVARALGLDPLTAAVATLFVANPTAPTSYVQARLMGGDARFMAASITLQHAAAVFTLPAWAWWLSR